MADQPIELTTQEARQGETPGIVRRVLLNSMIVVVAGLAVAFWFFS